ncbi:MAG: DUF5722 domain-containing protein, partial [Chloroflexota bacterium]|nr:DUF5722 domain-containing protein [Chloroflexota bacterium]
RVGPQGCPTWQMKTSAAPHLMEQEDNDVAAADYPYPTASTIKGLQVRMVDDAIKLGVRHAALNLNQGNIARPEPSHNTVTYVMDGRRFYFDETYLREYDKELKTLSDNGIVVNLILLNSVKWAGVEIHPEMRDILLHPDYDPEGFISAFNVVTDEGFAHYRAFVEFVAERYTRPDQKYGRACSFIIGNEVDAGWVWCNAGEKPIEEYVRQHSIAMRTAFYAARKKYAQARVYLSLTHHWNDSWKMEGVENLLRSYPGRQIIEVLNTRCQAEGDWDWSLAFHPYPQDLFHADFWNDDEALDSLDSPRITFRNLQVLSQYFAQPHLLYDGRMRHIILSEQGFHSDETEQSERIQAAAYAFAYWKVLQSPAIESFILHAHVDNRDEFDLNLGIWRRDKTAESADAPGTAKPVYQVFRDIDGPRQAELFEQARAVVGSGNWK